MMVDIFNTIRTNCVEPDLDLAGNSDKMKDYILEKYSAKSYSRALPFIVIEHFEGETYESQVLKFGTIEEVKKHVIGCRNDFPNNYVLDEVLETKGYRTIDVDEI